MVEALEDRELLDGAFLINPNLNLSRLWLDQAEPTIAVSPVHSDPSGAPRDVFVAAMNFWPMDGFYVAHTTDGGETWSERLMATGLPGGDSLPAAAADPSAAYDSFGNLFIAYATPGSGEVQVGVPMAVQGDTKKLKDPGRNWFPDMWKGMGVTIVDGNGDNHFRKVVSNTADELTLDQAWNAIANPTAYKIMTIFPAGVVAVSVDSGATFRFMDWLDDPYSIERLAPLDKPTVATGPGGPTSPGSVWVAFRDKSEEQRIVARGASVQGLANMGAFGTAQSITGSDQGLLLDIEVGPNGQILVLYQNIVPNSETTTLYVSWDRDGLGPNGFAAPVEATQTRVGAGLWILPQPGRPFGPGIHSGGTLAWDRDSDIFGRIYLVYTDRGTLMPNDDDTQIYVRYSDNGGETWSARKLVNDDEQNASQFFPVATVDETTGELGIAWYDTRDSTVGNEVAVYLTVSQDGGNTFLANARVSQGLSVAVEGSHGFADYMGLAFNRGYLYPVWADNSNSTGDNPDGHWSGLDIYTSRVQYLCACAPLGVSDGSEDFESQNPSVHLDRIDFLRQLVLAHWFESANRGEQPFQFSLSYRQDSSATGDKTQSNSLGEASLDLQDFDVLLQDLAGENAVETTKLLADEILGLLLTDQAVLIWGGKSDE